MAKAKPINVVIDISHHQQQVDFERIRDAGIVGVIHKASEGLTFVDQVYAERREAALDAGLLWGAYHFGVGADGSNQADAFLSAAQPDDQTLLVLDYEPNPHGPTMTLSQAREFVEHVAAVSGRYPGIYAGYMLKEQLGGPVAIDPILSKCFLWVAQYGSPRPLNIPATFGTWTFWQYTDGVHGVGPYDVDGVGRCDRDQFNGSLAQLRRLWGVS